MKRLLLLSLFSLLLLSSFAQVKVDTIILPRPVYLTILGVGTEHAQVAIIGNIAPADFSGMQAAGIFNVGRGPVSGLQMAGVSNHALDSLTGAQLAGCINTVHGNVRGLQAAGAINLTDANVYGAQLAGSVNIAGGNVEQLQISGGLNYAHDVRGMQIAGGLNVASGTVRGMQLSGGVNIARNVKGLQLGVVNLADSADGAMIGVFSFAVHGYHKLEFGWNETMPVNGAFRTGSKIFHNIFAVGIDTRQRDFIWGFGYGVGSALPLTNRIDLGMDLMSYHLNKGHFSTSMSDLWKLNLTFDVHLIKNLSIAAGPSLNVFVTDLHPYWNDSPVTGIAPYYFFTHTYSNRWNAKAWFGGSISIRLL